MRRGPGINNHSGSSHTPPAPQRSPAWCMPSDRPPQPAKMSMVARAMPSSPGKAEAAAAAAADASPTLPLPAAHAGWSRSRRVVGGM